MLTLLIAEAALETIPRHLTTHPSIVRDAQRQRKEPDAILLDRSYHHRAMLGLEENWKRGRPDIIHFCLLEALGSPLNMKGDLRTIVHARDENTFEFDPTARLPRDCLRFKGLVEQVIRKRRAPSTGPALISASKKSIGRLRDEINPSYTLGLTRAGKPSRLEDVTRRLSSESRPLAVIGGFPKGHFSRATMLLFDESVSVCEKGLDAWVVVQRLIYEYEKGTEGLSGGCDGADSQEDPARGRTTL